MKSRELTCITTMTLFAALAIPSHLSAQGQTTQHHHYKLIDLGTLGGPASRNDLAKPLNNRGTTVGVADTNTADPLYPNFNPLIRPGGAVADPYIYHAFQWKEGGLVDLGALPGANSSWASWTSESGLVAGQSINGVIDPITGWPEENAVLWKDGGIINLGTLGGYESGAGAVNNRGQVAGFSANTVSDPYSLFGVGTQTRAFLWQNGTMVDIGTLGGPDAAAPWINESGEIAGLSYTNSTPNPATGLPTTDPFLWQHGRMIDLGTLGGTFGSPGEGVALNDRGQVVGSSNLAGDVYFRPFLWTKSGPMQDLGTFGGNFGLANAINQAGEVAGWATNAGDQALLAFFWKDGELTNLGTVTGDVCSYAFGINSKGQVVGGSDDCLGGNSHPFLWENGGPIVDLNTLVVSGSGLQLTGAGYITGRGEISAGGVLSDGNGHAVLLIPCDEKHPNIEGCDYSMVDATGAPANQTITNPEFSYQPSGMPKGLQARRRRTLGPVSGPTR